MSQLASAQLGTLAFKIRPCPQRALYLTAQSHSKFLHCSITRRTPPVVGRYLWKIRGFNTSAVRWHGEIVKPQPGTGIKLTFRDSKGNDIKTVEGNEGDDILSLAHEYDVDLEGACEGSVACSTCHVIVDPAHFDILPEADDEENDMLDLAFGLEDTSRLGCQVKLTRELDGMVATLPSATRNMYVDGAKARTH
ncbi:uncharacterized protein L203_102285 [Cryptococcus depauperatus CBS 7841]|uniref:2Fe-2S ferredoxin-type domain-containing protein n=1 Tax=Cryptococcus depauperatus CBS 7841 TaxID=1295531 RepID=A0AAJ8JRM1_9TREE